MKGFFIYIGATGIIYITTAERSSLQSKKQMGQSKFVVFMYDFGNFS